MMERQARRSGAVMGFDTHMVAQEPCLLHIHPADSPPTFTNETSPHYAEALPESSTANTPPVTC